MKTNKLFNLLMLAAMAMAMISCDKDDPTPPNEEELITTLTYTLSPVDNGDLVILSVVDLDGDGGMDASITGGTLSANTVYNGSLTLLNQSINPAEDITEEIREEDEEHQFFFASTIDDLSISYQDQDDDGNPIGLATRLTTGNTGAGTLTVTLKHEPIKDAEGVSSGIITNAGGETDISVVFPINVQ